MNFDSIISLVQSLNTEAKALHYWASTRWSDGVVSCPRCECEKIYVFKDGVRYKCAGCLRQFNAKTNTILEGTKLPTLVWLTGMWLVLHKKGISSVELGKQLNVTQDTAWHMLQKIRVSMGHEDFVMLDGVVEIDETFVGGKSQFKHKNKRAKYLKEISDKRAWNDKTPVMGFLQRGGLLRANVIPSVKSDEINKQVRNRIVKGSVIMSDGYGGYNGFGHLYDVHTIDHSKGIYCVGENHTNTIEGFWSQMKKGLKGTYHWTSRKHLNKYVQEFVFKYNYRKFDKQSQIAHLICKNQLRITQKEIRSAA
jgi:transposase-like protein